MKTVYTNINRKIAWLVIRIRLYLYALIIVICFPCWSYRFCEACLCFTLLSWYILLCSSFRCFTHSVLRWTISYLFLPVKHSNHFHGVFYVTSKVNNFSQVFPFRTGLSPFGIYFYILTINTFLNNSFRYILFLNSVDSMNYISCGFVCFFKYFIPIRLE